MWITEQGRKRGECEVQQEHVTRRELGAHVQRRLADDWATGVMLSSTPLRAPPEPALPLVKEIPTDMHRLLITALLIVNVTEYFVSTSITWETIYITRCPKTLPIILFTVIGTKTHKMLSSKGNKWWACVYREKIMYESHKAGFSY